MYTHARQFPHLAGLNDQQIRALARNAMARRPRLILLMRARNAAIIAGMAIGAMALTQWAGAGLGLKLMIVGAAGTMVILIWNLAWVNLVLFRITKEELDAG